MQAFDRQDGIPLLQCGALCWRRVRGEVQVLLVTSRDTGRWVIPKGWPIPGRDMPDGAAREAWEEAGVRGETGPASLGLYAYDKVLGRDEPGPPSIPCVVEVWPLRVRVQQRKFPEAGERRPRWFPRDKAARKVTEPELAALIAGFDPRAAATVPVP